MESPQSLDEARLLTPEDLAVLMRVKVGWVHTHGRNLPFAIRLPGQKRVRLYSYLGFRKWQEGR